MYNTTTINQSATAVFPAGENISAGAFRTVKLDPQGRAVLCGAGDIPLGIIPGGVEDTVKTGEDISVQIKGMGICAAGGAVAAGAMVACGADGKCVAAGDGDPILGQAFTSAVQDGDTIKIQLLKGGFYKAPAEA